jgi:hypothetical protein
MLHSVKSKDFAAQYELAKKTGDKRYGSECKHEKTKNGICVNCKRKVVS